MKFICSSAAFFSRSLVRSTSDWAKRKNSILFAPRARRFSNCCPLLCHSFPSCIESVGDQGFRKSWSSAARVAFEFGANSSSEIDTSLGRCSNFSDAGEVYDQRAIGIKLLAASQNNSVRLIGGVLRPAAPAPAAPSGRRRFCGNRNRMGN